MRIARRLALAMLSGAVILGMGTACANASEDDPTAGSGGVANLGTAATPTMTQPTTKTQPPVNTAPTTEPQRAAAVVTVARTGGFAGVNQTVTVAADGAWVYTDSRNSKSSDRGTLTEAQRLDLVRLATAPEVFTELAPVKSTVQCADAFNYAINVDGRSGGFEECGDHPRPHVDALLAFLAAATPF